MARRRAGTVPVGDLEWGQVLELTVGMSGRCGHPKPDVGMRAGCPDPYECGLSDFGSSEDGRAAWFAHRDMLMPDPRGTRPPGFWTYEAAAHCRDFRRDAGFVCRHVGEVPEWIAALTWTGWRLPMLRWLDAHGLVDLEERAAIITEDQLRTSSPPNDPEDDDA